jgi:pilus assembly protein CpaE
LTNARIAAVGASSSIRPEVAKALGTEPDAVAWLPSVASAAREIAETHAFDVVVLGPTVRDEEAIGVAELLAREAPATAVLLVRDEPVDGAFPTLVRAGIRDVVDLTRGSGDLREALRRAVAWSDGLRGSTAGLNGNGKGRRGVIISVFSTKGGAGKTFLSCNLAVAIARSTGVPVGLLDLDHDLGDVFAYFGSEPKRSLHDLIALEEGTSPEDVTGLGTPLVDGVVGFGSPPDPRAAPMPGGAMTKMLRALQDAFAFTVADATSEYSDSVLSAFDLSDAICMISALDAIGVRHMSIGIQTLESLGVPRERLRIVLNRADSRVDLSIDDIERLLGVSVDAKIPSSPLVPRSINHGQLLLVEEPRSDVARSVTEFAERLVAALAPEMAAAAPAHRRGSWRRRG